MAGWFLVFLLSSFTAIYVFFNDPALKGQSFSLYPSKIETPDIKKEDQVLGAYTIMDELTPLLRGYLQAKGSPLASYAAEIVMTADRYNLTGDYFRRLLVKKARLVKKYLGTKKGKNLHTMLGVGVFTEIKCSLFQAGRKELRKLGRVLGTVILIKT